MKPETRVEDLANSGRFRFLDAKLSEALIETIKGSGQTKLLLERILAINMRKITSLKRPTSFQTVLLPLGRILTRLQRPHEPVNKVTVWRGRTEEN